MSNRSLLRQYLGALYGYSYKRSRTNKTNLYFEAFKGVFTMRPVFTSKEELKQVRNILYNSKIEKQEGRFFYSIDENLIPVYENRVIDNMPVDYSLVVDHGLNEYSGNYIELLCDYIDYLNVPMLQKMKYEKATSLEEALQRILFYNQLLWQTGHTLNGLGRLDVILDRFEITDQTQTLIKEFLTTLHNHYSFKSSMHLGDTGQIIILGGLTEEGGYFCNEYTLLFIKCIKELQLPDPKCLLRTSKATPDEVLKHAVECIETGIGSPLLSNDDIVVPALVKFGYRRSDAFNYGVSACWEPLSIGCSLEQNNMDEINFGNILYDACLDKRFLTVDDMDAFMELFCEHLEKHAEKLIERIDKVKFEYDPTLMFMFNGSFKYNNYGILTLGLASAVNSIINIDKYVYKAKLISKSNAQNLLRDNYKDNDDLRKLLQSTDGGFASSNESASELSKKIIECLETKVKPYINPLGGKLKFGLSSPNYITNGSKSHPTFDGRKAGDPFSEHISGHGDNALLDTVLFASRLDYNGVKANGNVVDILVQKSFIKDNENNFLSYIKDAIKLGIFQIQFNVVSLEELIDAQLHPEMHENLIVRVWGFSAYFVDLPVEYQNVLIARARG